MLQRALELLQVLSQEDAPPMIAHQKREAARNFLRTVTPTWDADRECLVAVHPEDGQTYKVLLEDANGTLPMHFDAEEDGTLVLDLDYTDSDFSAAIVAAYFQDERVPAHLTTCFFVSEDFVYDHRD